MARIPDGLSVRASGALRVPVPATYPLERVHEAFAAFGTGTLGKLAVTCD